MNWKAQYDFQKKQALLLSISKSEYIESNEKMLGM